MNYVILVGRLATEPMVVETLEGKTKVIIELAIQRDYKNVNGIYETDFINCTLWNGIASGVKDYCHKGDVIGIKGKLKVTKRNLEVVADKVTFIANSRNEEEK